MEKNIKFLNYLLYIFEVVRRNFDFLVLFVGEYMIFLKKVFLFLWVNKRNLEKNDKLVMILGRRKVVVRVIGLGFK